MDSMNKTRRHGVTVTVYHVGNVAATAKHH